MPVKFHSDRTILNTNFAALRLYEILRKDVFSDIETGPSWILHGVPQNITGVRTLIVRLRILNKNQLLFQAILKHEISKYQFVLK